jgi:hypothetical protein
MTENSSIYLTSKAIVDSRSLRLDYEISNSSEKILFVFTLISKVDLQPVPNSGYTCFVSIDKSLHVLLGKPPIPPGLDVFIKIVPYAFRLQPGDTHRDYLEFKLPVHEWQPYFDFEYPSENPNIPLSKIQLTVECMFEEDAFYVEPIRGYPNYFKTDGYPKFKLRADLSLSSPIPLLQRGDDFARF